MKCQRNNPLFCEGKAIGLIDNKPCCNGCREFNEPIEKFEK